MTLLLWLTFRTLSTQYRWNDQAPVEFREPLCPEANVANRPISNLLVFNKSVRARVDKMSVLITADFVLLSLSISQSSSHTCALPSGSTSARMNGLKNNKW